ncbi:MupA/Atu3671 family FMN-dependent luciferase-like monooxygenase [Streptomyces monomycini]|uniref:MupA/Atu3671 family FMN-dependent luciferase-like monooxygenase n=1 Tax=Streptomyces monomycini TaxID=371720 RepID=UPI001EEB1938|nr:MupA/Atu3671 family FMN-dependent luciferase-like monooxygenase [Streptomyces monomycini]
MTGLSAAAAAVDQDLAAMSDLSRRIAERIEAAAGVGAGGTDEAGGTTETGAGGQPTTGAADQPAPGDQAVAAAPPPNGTAQEPSAERRQRVHGPRVTVSRASGMVGGSASEAQQAHLDDLVRRYTAKTATSKEIAQRYRRVLADSRAVVGFRSKTREMLYPIAGRRAHGSRLEDIDGNRYVDITMGFGVLLFGHEPDFVSEAVREHLSRGIQLGPRNVETGEAAELLAELTGMERVAFANSGTEANSAAIRLARAATGRRRIVTFHGAYHGHADNVLGRSAGTGADRITVPVSTGIPSASVADLLVLDYGSDASLEVIAEHADDIAAVIIEPVQSRHPSLRPVGFVRQLRELTRRHGIVLMFDEMLTGFRPAPRGAQELYGVTPDLATYGKLLGGGFPIGAIAGRADIMDGVDGGFWQYGDASYPPADTTFFGGTYIQHPVSMVAARAVLTHLKEHSPRLQERLNARTAELADSLNRFFDDEGFPLSVSRFGSQFRFEHRADMELLYHHLMLRGVHVWEWRNFFLSTAHSDGDIEFIADAVRGSLRDLRAAGFFPGGPTGGPKTLPTAGAQAPAATQTPAAPRTSATKAQASTQAQISVATQGPAATQGPGIVRLPEVAQAPAGAQAQEVTQAPVPRTGPSSSTVAARRAPDFSIYFFGDYPQDEAEAEAGAGAESGAGAGSPAAAQGKYDHILETARFADQHGFHALWMPERHFHSFGGLFPNPVVLAAALARETRHVRLNAGSVVLPLHDPVRVAEEWSMADNLSGGRVGIGCASGWHANDFVFFPDRFGRHKEMMYEQVEQVRRLWRGEAVRRTGGDGETEVRLFPRPVQDAPPMYTAVVGNPASYVAAARNDVGVVTNLMTQSVEQLAENIALYRRTRAEHGLDPDAGRVAVLLHTYLAADHRTARAEAYEPLARYMRASLSLFGNVANSLGHNVDLSALTEDDLDVLFRRAYDRYCDQRALIGTPDTVASVVDAVRAAGADEIVSLVDFGVQPGALRTGLTHIDALRRRYHAPGADTGADTGAQAGVHAGADTGTSAGTSADAPTSAPYPYENVAPLSPGQQRIWFLERMLPGRTAYNETKAIRLDGPLDVPALRTALRDLVARHEGLRTVFREIDDEPCQLVRPPSAPDFAVLDRTGAGADGEEAADAAVRAVLAEESARRFDLVDGPLFVTRLVKLGEERHVLVFSLHHIVVDAASATVLARDLSALYRAAHHGSDAGLPALSGTYADHARAQLRTLDDPARAADLTYWLDTLGGELPVLELPCDRPRPAAMTSNGRAVFHRIDPELSDRLRDLSRQRRGTLFMTLLAGFTAMLHRVTGQRDIVVGTPISDRPQGTEDLLGFFVNTLALRFDLSGDPEFATFLDRVRGVALDAYDHADVPFETVVRELAPARTTDRTPVFQVLAEFESSDPFRFDLPGVRATVIDAGPDKALTDLAVYFTDQPEGIRCHLEYNTDLFDAGTVDGFFRTFRDLLEAAVQEPGTPLSRLGATPVRQETAQAVTPAPERQAMATAARQRGMVAVPPVEPAAQPVPAAWQQGPVRPVARVTVHELVARRAADAPYRTAVQHGDDRLSYRELDTRAERLAAVVRERSGTAAAATADGADDVVALWLPRSADLVVAMLAVLKSGLAYVPLDPSLGRARAATVIAESGARLLLSTGSGADELDLPDGLAVIDVTAAGDGATDRPKKKAPSDAAGPESLCYVIYTSGSTGKPKGVAVPHRAVVDLCQWHHKRFAFTSADRSALVCSQSFDASVLEIWPALTAGASLVIADDTVRADTAELARWYAQQHVTFSILPTALGEALLTLPPAEQPPLRHLLLGGDVMRTRPHPDVAYETVNVYGPTETTVLCTIETVGPRTPDTGSGPIPIGRPADNVSLRVLDTSGAPVPLGTVGELYVGGPGIARGYLGVPVSADDRFGPDPLGAESGTGAATAETPGASGDGARPAGHRFYRTGDLVRWTEDGALEFRGRADDQVKVRGYRVEPEEAARALNALDGVREAVVVARRDSRGEAYLAAYAVPADRDADATATAAGRRTYADRLARELAARLPEYLVPRSWAVLTALPLGGNGKLDRAALPDPEIVTSARPAPASEKPGQDARQTASVPAAAAAASADGPEPGLRDRIEHRLRALWADAFGLTADAIGPDASFFDLGGHSIAAIRLVNRAREVFGQEYPMVRFYQEPTVRAMAAYLAGDTGTDGSAEGTGAKRSEDTRTGAGTRAGAGAGAGGRGGAATGTDTGTHGEPDGATDVVDRAPATYQQQGFIAQDHHPTPHVFNVALRITLTGGLDLPALRTALSQLIARHESLRTRFVQEDGQWWQEILRPRPVDLQVEDLTTGRGTGAGTAGSAGTVDAEIEQISAQAAATRFDFGEGVAPKLRLVRSGPSTWVLFFVLHHSTCDGWAVSVLLSDFAALYGAAATGTPHTLASTVPQPTEYARWQRETAPERPDQRILKYWARELDGAPFELGLPLDRPRPETLSGQGRVVLFSVDTDLLADVERLARKCGTTPYAVTTAALGQLIGTLSGRTDVVANVAYANRERRAFESLMACTAVGLPLRIRLDGDGTFTDLVRQVAHTSIEGIDHIMSLRRLVEPLREEMGVEVPDHVPFGFAYQSSLQTDIELPGVAAVVEDLAVPAARTDLSVGLIPAGDTLTGYMEYSTDLWEQSTVEGWADAYVTLLAEEVRAALED